MIMNFRKKYHGKVFESAGRPRTHRIKLAFESISKRKHKCPECKEFGHLSKTCPKVHPKRNPRKRKRKNVEPQDIEDIEVDAIEVETMGSTSGKNDATKKKNGGAKRAKSTPEASKKTSTTHDSPAKNTRSKCPPSKNTRSKNCPSSKSARSKKKS